MTYVLAVFVFPLLLAVLSLGFGLLVERISGWSVPALLLAPLGFAAIIGLSQLTTWIGPIAPATPWILLAVALGGFVLTRRALAARWAARRSGWWWGFAAGAVAYLIAVAPVLLSFRATFPAYLLDTSGSVQLMGAERLVTEGHNWTVPNSGYGLQLFGYFGTGYPSGSHSALGGLGRLVPVDYLWLYAPYLSAMLGLTGLVLAWIARRVGLPLWTAAVAGCIASMPALVYAYLLQGAIKEIVLLPVLMLLGALILLAREQFSPGPRGVVPLAVAGAAGWGAIGLAFTPWLALAAAGILVLGVTATPGGRPAWVSGTALRVGVLLGVLILLALPTIAELKTAIDQATGVSNSNAAAAGDPGNLLRPLLDVQLFGVWINGSHRVDPDQYLRLTYIGIGVVAVASMLGLVWLIRRRQWAALVWVGTSLLVWLALTPRATTWTAAKLIVLFSPVVLLVAMLGAFGRLGSRRLEGLALGAAVAGLVLFSNAFLYHYTGLAPTHRFDEMRDIGQRYAGDTPTLAPDFDEYGLYLLRDMAPDSPGNARKVAPWTTVTGEGTGYGRSYDLDDLPTDLVDRYRAIVVRRSPYKSRPPGDYRRVWEGDYYDVWQRDPAIPPPLLHRGLGDSDGPAEIVACRAIGAFAAEAKARGATELTYAPRPENVDVDMRTAGGSSNVVWNREAQPPSASFYGPGTLTADVNVPVAGEYRVWARGNTGRELRAVVDGQSLGGVRNESGGDGNVLRYGTIRLGPGEHRVELVRGGGTLRPGDADATTISGVALEPVRAEAMPTESVPLASWRSLCGGSYDWLEAR